MDTEKPAVVFLADLVMEFFKHFSYVTLIAAAPTDPTGSSPQYFFYSINIYLVIGHPNQCCIFKFGRTNFAAALVYFHAKVSFYEENLIS